MNPKPVIIGDCGSSGRVGRWRGGLGTAYLLPALSIAGASIALPCSVSTLPLIKPDVRFSRIRLSLFFLLQAVEVKSAHRQTSTSAMNIGNITHDWVEEAINFHMKGGVIPKLPTQEEALNSIDAFKAWVQENAIEWLSAEEKLYHRKHKYAGTVDARAYINGEYCVIDWKTSKAVYPEYHLQVAA